MEWFDKELFMCIGELYIVVSDRNRSPSAKLTGLSMAEDYVM